MVPLPCICKHFKPFDCEKFKTLFEGVKFMMNLHFNTLVSQYLKRAFFLALVCAFISTSFSFDANTSQAFAQEEDEDEELEERSGTLETFDSHPEMATIYVVRERKFKGSAVKKKIYFNYEYVGKIGNAKYAVFQVPPGEYLLGVLDDSDKRSIILNVEAGQVYYAQLKLKFGIAKARGQFIHISENDAKAMVPKLYKAKAKDIEKYSAE